MLYPPRLHRAPRYPHTSAQTPTASILTQGAPRPILERKGKSQDDLIYGLNFLLQRMETHDGISILTTNLGTGIDQAFKRRLRFRLHFDMPGAAEREILWKSMVPPGCTIEPDVDWRYLAKRWEMSGAIIRNAMLRAAFLSAAQDRPLSNALLQQAARAELIELGRLGS